MLHVKLVVSEAVYKALRGKQKKSDDNKYFIEKNKGIALMLPSWRTLQSYTLSPTFKYGVDEMIIEIMAEVIDMKKYGKTFGIAMDEMQIAAGICFDITTGMVTGFCDEVTVENVEEFYSSNKEKIETKMATKVMQVIITSVSEGYCFTLACFLTNQATVESVNFLIFFNTKRINVKNYFYYLKVVDTFLECDKSVMKKEWRYNLFLLMDL